MDSVKNTVAAGASAFREDGAIGSAFTAEGSIGSIPQSVGGPLDKDGAIGHAFTTDGAIGGTGQAVAENVSGAAGSATSDPQNSAANASDHAPTL